MSKAADGLNTVTEHVKPSRRRALSIFASAAPVLSMAGSAFAGVTVKSPAHSAKIAAAFAEWRNSCAVRDAAMAAASVASDRYDAILPGWSEWSRPLNPERLAACNAAKEMSGVTAAEAAVDAALDEENRLFLALLSLQPETMADVVLQAKQLKEWLHMCQVELPAEVWLESITGEAWPDHVLSDSSEGA